MKREKRDPVYVGWILFLVFLLLCGTALAWAGILRGKPLPRLRTTTAHNIGQMAGTT